MMQKGRLIYPFTAIVGQKRMPKGLILSVINPKIGGILIQGEKGTSKSTAVRALAALLPEIEVVDGCRYSCDPGNHDLLCKDCLAHISKGKRLHVTRRRVRVVDVPVSITEDRLVGSLDLSHAVKSGCRKFEPGLLARANRDVSIDRDRLQNVIAGYQA